MLDRLKLQGQLFMEFVKIAQILKMMIFFLAFAHLNACLFWTVGSYSLQNATYQGVATEMVYNTSTLALLLENHGCAPGELGWDDTDHPTNSNSNSNSDLCYAQATHLLVETCEDYWDSNSQPCYSPSLVGWNRTTMEESFAWMQLPDVPVPDGDVEIRGRVPELLTSYRCACTEYEDGKSWIIEAGVGDHVIENGHPTHHTRQYLTSLYFSLTTLTTVGYGDITAESTIEKAFVIYMLVVGALVYACIFGFVTNTVQNMMKNSEMFRERLESIETFSVLHQLPDEMEERMTGYVQYLWHHTKVMRNGIKQSDVLADMPSAMITQVLMYLYAQDVKKVPMFKGLDDSFIKQLVVHLDDCVCLRDDYVFEKNDVGQNMFFIRDGRAKVLAEDKGAGPVILAILVRGSFFGEISLVTGGKRTATIQAISNMEMFSLAKDVLDELMEHFPEYHVMIYKSAQKRLVRSASAIVGRHSPLPLPWHNLSVVLASHPAPTFVSYSCSSLFFSPPPLLVFSLFLSFSLSRSLVLSPSPPFIWNILSLPPFNW
jgi:hypothetical protein